MGNFGPVMCSWGGCKFQVRNRGLPEIVAKSGVRVVYDCVLVPRACTVCTISLLVWCMGVVLVGFSLTLGWMVSTNPLCLLLGVPLMWTGECCVTGAGVLLGFPWKFGIILQRSDRAAIVLRIIRGRIIYGLFGYIGASKAILGHCWGINGLRFVNIWVLAQDEWLLPLS